MIDGTVARKTNAVSKFGAKIEFILKSYIPLYRRQAKGDILVCRNQYFLFTVKRVIF